MGSLCSVSTENVTIRGTRSTSWKKTVLQNASFGLPLSALPDMRKRMQNKKLLRPTEEKLLSSLDDSCFSKDTRASS
jgi:hypothetical protein